MIKRAWLATYKKCFHSIVYRRKIPARCLRGGMASLQQQLLHSIEDYITSSLLFLPTVGRTDLPSALSSTVTGPTSSTTTNFARSASALEAHRLSSFCRKRRNDRTTPRLRCYEVDATQLAKIFVFICFFFLSRTTRWPTCRLLSRLPRSTSTFRRCSTLKVGTCRLRFFFCCLFAEAGRRKLYECCAAPFPSPLPVLCRYDLEERFKTCLFSPL